MEPTMNLRGGHLLKHSQRGPVRALQTVHVHWFSGFI